MQRAWNTSCWHLWIYRWPQRTIIWRLLPMKHDEFTKISMKQVTTLTSMTALSLKLTPCPSESLTDPPYMMYTIQWHNTETITRGGTTSFQMLTIPPRKQPVTGGKYGIATVTGMDLDCWPWSSSSTMCTTDSRNCLDDVDISSALKIACVLWCIVAPS